MYETVNLLITFDDGSFMTVEDVTSYGFEKESGCFYYWKGSWKSYLPKEHIVYIGKKENWGK